MFSLVGDGELKDVGTERTKKDDDVYKRLDEFNEFYAGCKSALVQAVNSLWQTNMLFNELCYNRAPVQRSGMRQSPREPRSVLSLTFC